MRLDDTILVLKLESHDNIIMFLHQMNYQKLKLNIHFTFKFTQVYPAHYLYGRGASVFSPVNVINSKCIFVFCL